MIKRIKHSKAGDTQRKTIDMWSNRCNTLENELWVMMDGDENEIKKLRNFCFEYAYKESDYVGIQRQGLQWDLMTIMRRGIV